MKKRLLKISCIFCMFFVFSYQNVAQAQTSLSQFATEFLDYMEKEGFAVQNGSDVKSTVPKNSFSSLLNTPSTNNATINNIALTKAQAQSAIDELLAKRDQAYLHTFGKEWDSRNLKNKGYEMPFDIKIFGKAPATGRSMYISMHGGGGTTAETNNQQWENQKRLYTLKEGVYFVPRSPTNTWNMWHQDYMDGFIQKAIELAVLKEGVNPNKVYIMGYSAGGDGVYQLATRLPDLFAGAAMSAGHPGDAHIENLLNLPFGLYMGGQDSAYDRNKHAKTWEKRLKKLAQESEGAYVHDVQIFPQFGHWMEKKDAVGITFMSQYTRNPIPYEVYWIQDDVLRDHFYWISTVPKSKHQNAKIRVFYNDDESLFYIENDTNVKSFIININDAMLDLDKKIKIYRKDKLIYHDFIPRTKENIRKDVAAGRGTDLIFPAKVLIDNMKVRILGL